MARWVVYCAGNSQYILSPNKEPVKMLNSFQKHFGEELDYVYFTDKDEPNLDKVKKVCDDNNIRLIIGDCKQYYSNYNDYQYVLGQREPRWPDAHYWYCEAPDYFMADYDYAIKCDGDMMCLQKFNLSLLEVENEITAAHSPSWYNAHDKHCANAGFQIINIKNYSNNNVKQLFRQFSDNRRTYMQFNGDTPVLNYLVGAGILKVNMVPAEYNYLLFDIEQVKNLTLEDFTEVKIVHFVETKPHNLTKDMTDTVKHHFCKIYEEY